MLFVLAILLAGLIIHDIFAERDYRRRISLGKARAKDRFTEQGFIYGGPMDESPVALPAEATERSGEMSTDQETVRGRLTITMMVAGLISDAIEDARHANREWPVCMQYAERIVAVLRVEDCRA